MKNEVSWFALGVVFVVALVIILVIAFVSAETQFCRITQDYSELQQSYNQLEIQLTQTQDELAQERAKTLACDELRNFTSRGELEQFLAEDKTNELEYIKGVFDCVDFAMELQRNALEQGYLMNTQMLFMNHMMNMCVAGDSVYYVEPTSDEIMFVNYL